MRRKLGPKALIAGSNPVLYIHTRSSRAERRLDKAKVASSNLAECIVRPGGPALSAFIGCLDKGPRMGIPLSSFEDKDPVRIRGRVADIISGL